MKNALKKLLIVTLSIALAIGLFWMIPSDTIYAEGKDAEDEDADATDTDSDDSEYTEDDYTYMYLVKSKKTKYEKYTYKYNEYGLVDGSVYDNKSSSYYLGETSYAYDSAGNLLEVDGPNFNFKYSYNDYGKIKKFNMSCGVAGVGHDGPTEFEYTLKYRKKDKSIYLKYCGWVDLLPKGNRYFFPKGWKVNKSTTYENQYMQRYSYDKKNNIILDTDIEKNNGYIFKIRYKLKYDKSKKLVKRKRIASDVKRTTTYKYVKLRVLKKYLKKIEEQQWRILNFEDREALGLNQPWRY